MRSWRCELVLVALAACNGGAASAPRDLPAEYVGTWVGSGDGITDVAIVVEAGGVYHLTGALDGKPIAEDGDWDHAAKTAADPEVLLFHFPDHRHAPDGAAAHGAVIDDAQHLTLHFNRFPEHGDGLVTVPLVRRVGCREALAHVQTLVPADGQAKAQQAFEESVARCEQDPHRDTITACLATATTWDAVTHCGK